jgi:hypothetical protein
MTRSVTAREAQLARLAWVLKEGASAAGITLSQPGIQRLTMSIQNVMEANKMTLIWDRTVSELAAELAADLLAGK